MKTIEITYTVTCDRCGFTCVTDHDPSDDGYIGAWEYWGRIGWPDTHKLLCPDCVAGLKGWQDPKDHALDY